MVMCVASGVRFLDRRTTKTKCMYLALEESWRNVALRVRSMATLKMLEDTTGIEYLFW